MPSPRTFTRGLVAAFALLCAAVPAGVAATTATAGAAAAAPEPGACPAVVVHSAELVRTTSGPAILVTGVAPHADTRLRLEAERIDYVQQPDFWSYAVVGCGGTGPVVKTPFTVRFEVPSYPVGRLGITVNGIPIELGDGPGQDA